MCSLFECNLECRSMLLCSNLCQRKGLPWMPMPHVASRYLKTLPTAGVWVLIWAMSSKKWNGSITGLIPELMAKERLLLIWPPSTEPFLSHIVLTCDSLQTPSGISFCYGLVSPLIPCLMKISCDISWQRVNHCDSSWSLYVWWPFLLHDHVDIVAWWYDVLVILAWIF